MFGPRLSTSTSSQPFWGYSPARKITLSYNITLEKDSLAAKDIQPILEDPHQFFSTFCIAYASLDQSAKNSFSTRVKKDLLIITGKEHIVNSIERCIENIRKHFLNAVHQRKTFYILAVDIAGNIYLKSPAPVLNLTRWEETNNISQFWFNQFVQPGMKPFAQSLGVRCSDIIINDQQIQNEKFRPVTIEDTPAFKIQWL